MSCRSRRWICAGIGALLLAAGTALADDWPQFRRDAERSAASKDSTLLPLTEIWSEARGAGLLRGGSTSSELVVWNGALFYVGAAPQLNQLPATALVCADARSGGRLWVRPLSGPAFGASESGTHVAVSQSGLVYAEGAVPSDVARATGMRNALSTPGIPNFAVEVYQAQNGLPVARYLPRSFLPDKDVPHDSVTRLFFTHGRTPLLADDEANALARFRLAEGVLANAPSVLSPEELVGAPSDWNLPHLIFDGTQVGAFLPQAESFSGLGRLLLRGKEVVGTFSGDHLFQWDLGPYGRSTRLIHPLPQHTNLDWVPMTMLGGFPPTSVGRAVVVGADYGNRFLAVVEPSAGGRRYAWWHRDWEHSIGIPTVANNRIFLGAGGMNADEGIYGLDASSGVTLWKYAPTGFRSELPFREQYLAWSWFDYVPVPVVDPSSGKKTIQWHKRVLDSGRQSVPNWPSAHAFLRNPGVVASGERLYGAAGGRVAALDQQTGKETWTWVIPPGLRVSSLAASEAHLFVVLEAPAKKLGPRGAVCALRLTDGQELWNSILPQSAEPALANGILFLSDQETIRAFAPAERTFRLAIDSNRSEEYLPARAASPAPLPESKVGQSPGTQAPTPPLSPGRADATVLRLKWGTPLPALLEQIRRRRAAAPTTPLLLSLDWLDARREAPLGPVLTANGQAEFAHLCGQLAAAARPAWFDLAPEVNIYLARNPTQQIAVIALLRAAGAAVHTAYGPTKITASCNLEVLTSKYGNTDYQPFGKVPRTPKQPTELLPALGEVIDAVGVTSYPQCAYARPENVPGDHFLALRDALRKDLLDKPLLVTQIAVWRNLKLADAAARQAAFVRRALRACYWLDAPIVAYPEALEEPEAMGASLRISAGKNASGDPEAEWREVLAWKRVAKLSTVVPPFSVLPGGGQPGAPGPADPAAAAHPTPGQ